MEKILLLKDEMCWSEIFNWVFHQKLIAKIQLTPELEAKIRKTNHYLLELIKKEVPVYGVNTGLGESCFRLISLQQEEQLQVNLISYLTCGTGEMIPLNVVRATMILRLISLTRGHSGVSIELIERLEDFIINEWYPQIPIEGSLGASGDLIPLAYLARALQGNGDIILGKSDKHLRQGEKISLKQLLHEKNLTPYILKPKEGLALINGTSVMTAFALVNLCEAKFLSELSLLCTSWLCLCLEGRTEAFGDLVNKKAKYHEGQYRAALQIRELINIENYQVTDFKDIPKKDNKTLTFIQDPYSLRCVPQIMGPILETLDLIQTWIVREINSVSDNPLIDEEGQLATGGNFYGGHIGHGMDYLKISLGHIADMIDRQLMLLISEKTNRGLPANLANWPGIPENERHLHHGLKGLHQLVSAVTSEIMAKSIPNGIFSRSSESHNQDKVSLGMSAASSCHDILRSMFNIMGAYMICLAQAIDLKNIKFQSPLSQKYYNLIRTHVPFVEVDQQLDVQLNSLIKDLKRVSLEKDLFMERLS